MTENKLHHCIHALTSPLPPTTVHNRIAFNIAQNSKKLRFFKKTIIIPQALTVSRVMFLDLFFLVVALLQLGVEAGKPTTLNNSSLSLILGDQCVTRDEVRDVIRNEMQSVVRTEVESIVRSQVQTLVNYVTNVQYNNTALLREVIGPGGLEQNPAYSCTTIPQWRPSGIYWVQGIDGSASQQYCDMTRICCGKIGGWMRVANLDMKDTNQQCPSEFRLVTSPRRSCGRPGPAGCVSTTLPVHTVEYSRVCGKIIGYQSGSPDAFYTHDYYGGTLTIDRNYVDGVSLTYGRSPRKHIWTFAAALDEYHSNEHVCPCTRPDLTYTGTVPIFIGQDYFCETGSRNKYRVDRFFTEDPLWDGTGCGNQTTCCSFSNPPWFCKELPQPTRDDIELRMCSNNEAANEDTPLEVVEIYVQ